MAVGQQPAFAAATALLLILAHLPGSCDAGPTAVSGGQATLRGQPWLPWGVYLQGASAEDLRTVREAGFNTVLAYEQ